MTIWQFVTRSMISTLLLSALLPLAAANATPATDSFWGHRIGLQVDVAYGENRPKFWISTYMATHR